MGRSAVGLAGVILHLDSRFFDDRTIRSLTYAARFAAPLAYVGLGLLLLVNRLVEPDTLEWAQRNLLLSLGRFVGNFVFSLPITRGTRSSIRSSGFLSSASALAIGFVLVPFVVRITVPYLWPCASVLAPGVTLFERALSGAPPMTPLLFPNLVLLALIALLTWAAHLTRSSVRS